MITSLRLQAVADLIPHRLPVPYLNDNPRFEIYDNPVALTQHAITAAATGRCFFTQRTLLSEEIHALYPLVVGWLGLLFTTSTGTLPSIFSTNKKRTSITRIGLERDL